MLYIVSKKVCKNSKELRKKRIWNRMLILRYITILINITRIITRLSILATIFFVISSLSEEAQDSIRRITQDASKYKTHRGAFLSKWTSFIHSEEVYKKSSNDRYSVPWRDLKKKTNLKTYVILAIDRIEKKKRKIRRAKERERKTSSHRD